MYPDQILSAINEHLRANSGFETDRRYLGMSSIGQCPLNLYRAFVDGLPARLALPAAGLPVAGEQAGGQAQAGRQPTDVMRRYCYVGYLFERDARQRLEALGLYRPPSVAEVVAPFDSRFRGHVDGETAERELLEIKSVSEAGLERAIASGRAKSVHFKQVQCYLRYGPWPRAIVLYISRESFQHYAVTVPVLPGVGERLERKAKLILAAVDAGQPPACECGHCE